MQVFHVGFLVASLTVVHEKSGVLLLFTVTYNHELLFIFVAWCYVIIAFTHQPFLFCDHGAGSSNCGVEERLRKQVHQNSTHGSSKSYEVHLDQ